MTLARYELSAEGIQPNMDSYFTGIIGRFVMFAVGFGEYLALPPKPRDLTNLSIWTLDSDPLD